jgi:hypothetical protein
MRTRKLLPAAVIVLAAGAVEQDASAGPMSTSPEQAYDMGQIPSARATGMGDALTALGGSTTALYLNPANMALARVYHLEGLAAFSPESQRQTYGLAIVDSVINTAHLSGGVAGAWSEIDPGGLHRTWTDIRAALALPLGDYLAVGATGRWLQVDQALNAGVFGLGGANPLTTTDFPASGTPNGSVYNGLTFDLGATAAVEGFRLGLVGHNLTNPGNALAPTTGAAGLGYGNDTFSLELDGLLDFTTFGHTTGRVMAGGEIFVANHYAIRAGWRYDTGMNINAPSLGFGYVDPKWSVELGVRHDLLSDHASTLAVLSLRYFYDATSSTPADEPDQL